MGYFRRTTGIVTRTLGRERGPVVVGLLGGPAAGLAISGAADSGSGLREAALVCFALALLSLSVDFVLHRNQPDRAGTHPRAR